LKTNHVAPTAVKDSSQFADIQFESIFTDANPMNQRFKGWLQALALSAACAGATAYLNLTPRESTHLQPSWLTYLHVGCAFFGVLAFTWFIQGTPAALRETTNRAVVAQGFIARPIVGARASAGTGNLVVPAKSAFLSTPRCPMRFSHSLR
jgi:hypothetical protein